jgi:hypothetical protein
VVSHGLVNSPGITSIDGLTVPAPYFDENMPLRDGVPLDVKLSDGTTRTIVSPVTNDVTGAMAIQQAFDNWEWVSLGGDPVAYAPHLRKDPLPGVEAKSVLVQFAKGDVYAENPTTTAFLRAGDLADRATYYRYDLTPVYSQDPNLRTPTGYPHPFAALTASANSTIKNIALAAQRQIAAFFASDGAAIIQPPGVPLAYFEVGLDESELPEGLNYTVVATPLSPLSAASAASDASDLGWLALEATTIAPPGGVGRFSAPPLYDGAAMVPAQRERSPVVSDKREGAIDKALATGMQLRRLAGFALRDLGIVDRVFAASAWRLPAIL